MLNLITQDGMKKVVVDSYQVKNCTGTAGAYKIYGENNGTTAGELAEYKEFDDAARVFWAMVTAESRGLFVQLPDDDPKEIASFCALVKTTSGQCFDDKFC